ncbi:helix-turn-helix transcriptional regulator [Actinomycetaceae bacterium L2_0104]
MPIAQDRLEPAQRRQSDVFRRLMGEKIAEQRKRKRWSQEALAHNAGWSRQQLSRVELGKSSIAADRLLLLAEVLECEVTDLVPMRIEVLHSTHYPERHDMHFNYYWQPPED